MGAVSSCSRVDSVILKHILEPKVESAVVVAPTLEKVSWLYREMIVLPSLSTRPQG